MSAHLSHLLTPVEEMLELPPFSSAAYNQFYAAYSGLANYHSEQNPWIKKFYTTQKREPSLKIHSESELIADPFLMVHLFKERDWITGRPEDLVLTLTSSGTGGQKSQMKLNAWSMVNVKRAAFQVHRDLGLTSDEQVNYLCFTYDPKVAKDLGTAFTDELLTSFTGISNVYYAIQWDEKKKDWALNEDGVVEILKKYQSEGKPTRILGFPAFLVNIIEKYSLKLNLGSNSWVQTGGGWKNHKGHQMPKFELRPWIATHLGIPIENIRDLFGMVEHGIAYVDNHQGQLQIPSYSRVIVRCPQTLQPQQDGKQGLLQFVCAYNSSYPSFNFLSTDIGKVINHQDGSRELMILGRAGKSKHKGCAIKASELLGEI